MGKHEHVSHTVRVLYRPLSLQTNTTTVGRLPVVNFAAGGVAFAMMIQLGCDGVFVGSGIFKSDNPADRARAIERIRPAFIRHCKDIA